MSCLIPSRRTAACSAAVLSVLFAASALAATKERVYTMGDNDPGAVVGGKPPLNTSINRYETMDIQPSTTDYRGTDNQVNVSLVPLRVFIAGNPAFDFSPRYVAAPDRPGAAEGNLALSFDGNPLPTQGDNMFSEVWDPRDFSTFDTLAQAWVKPTLSTADQYIFRVGRENGAAKITSTGFWALRTAETAPPPDVAEVISTVPVALNQWTHVAVLRGGNVSTLYINGSVAARDNGFWGADGPDVTLGANTQGVDSFFQGVIDNFSLASTVGGFDSGSDLDFFADNGITFSGIAGDIDQDGLVNMDDYLIWSDNVGFATGVGVGDASSLLKGDADRSGRIDLFDFRIIQQNALAGGTPLSIGVPEPATAALVVAGIFTWGAVRRGRRARSARTRSMAARAAALAAVAAVGLATSSAHAVVVVSEDFLYDGPTKTLHVGGGFTGNTRYAGGQSGPAGNWTGLWGSIGDGIVTTPDYIPPNPPGTPEPGTPFQAALYDGFFGVQSELIRGFDLAPSVALNQTLYFGGRFKADLDIGSDGRTVPQFYAPRLFLNRIGGDDRYFDPVNPGVPLPQRNRAQDIGLGIESYRNNTTLMLENQVVARLGAGPETRTTVLAAPPSDGNWHSLIGKLEINVGGGANERLTVWYDPTGVETGGTTAQLEADLLPDLSALIGVFHSQGTRPVNPLNVAGLPTDPADSLIDMPQEAGRSYIDDMAIGTAWQDVAAVNVPRLTLRINPNTGVGQLLNTTTTTFSLDGYSIESTTNSLNGTAWNSLDEQNVGNWHEDLATSGQIVETNFLSSTPLAPGGQLTLGNLFTVGANQFVTGRYSTGDGLINLLNVQFSTAGLLGDYDANGRVDGRDFLVWQQTLGTTVPQGTGADGDNSSKIDAGDLTVWRNNFGATATAAGNAVPEPKTAVLFGVTVVLLATHRPWICNSRQHEDRRDEG